LLTGAATVACPVAPTAASPAAAAPAPACPGPETAALMTLLETLRGRPVALLVGGHKLYGRVISTQPLTLADGEGRATQVDPTRIQSCQF